jgi:hypothetical protein
VLAQVGGRGAPLEPALELELELELAPPGGSLAGSSEEQCAESTSPKATSGTKVRMLFMVA